jgi:hypothetical protein
VMARPNCHGSVVLARITAGEDENDGDGEDEGSKD